MHFVGTVGDAAKARLVKDVGQRSVLGHTHAAVNLDRPVGYILAHLRCHDLEHRNQIARLLCTVLVHLVGRGEHEQPKLFDFAARVCDVLPHAAFFLNLLTKRDAFLGTLAHQFKTTLSEPNEAHRILKASRA